MTDTLRDSFDRTIGAIDGLPDVHKTKPTTITTVAPILGDSETFVVQTYHQHGVGHTAFIQMVNAQGRVRLVLPPAVTRAIYAQHDRLTTKVRSDAGKRRWDNMTDDQRRATTERLRRKG